MPIAVTGTFLCLHAASPRAATALPLSGHAGVPLLVTPPTISGQARTGAALTSTGGVWNRAGANSLAFQWYRCRTNGGTCVALATRNSSTYVPTRADVGFALRVEVTATGSAGSTRGSSAPTAAVVLSDAPIECHGITVDPSMSLQAAIDANPPGTTICLRSGIYRLAAAVVPKANDALIGQPGTVLSGARDITGTFTRTGSAWVASNMTMEGYDPRPCIGGSAVTSCSWLNDVYFDDAALKRVASLAAVRSGAFFFDYPNDRIYIGDNPAGHRVEVGVTDSAIATLSRQHYPEGVTIEGITFEKFATRAQHAAVEGFNDWTVEDDVFRLNHAVGLSVGRDSIVRGNSFVSNGQLGFGIGYWTNLLFEDNLLERNNYAGYSTNWEAGGAKFYAVHGLTVRNNVARGNIGVGLWSDWENLNALYEGNRVENNTAAGIFYEAGYDAVIRGNLVAGNGFHSDGWVDGSGILVNSSTNVEITGNTLLDNDQGIGATATDRGTGALGPRELRNLYVHDNLVRMTKTPPDYWTVAAGIAGDDRRTAFTPSYGNRWQGNKYVTCSYVRFHWKVGTVPASPFTWAQWQAAGMDTRGSLTQAC